MFDKLQMHSLVTSVLLLPTLIITTQQTGSSAVDFVFNNSINYPIYELSITSNDMEKWEKGVLAENILQLGN
jgi:hypothetical protein